MILVPDNLWVKDKQSRFVMANTVTARRMGYDRPQDLIGKTDLELCPVDTALKYFSDEQSVIESGCAITDKNEYVIGTLGKKTWISTTKAPLRNNAGEIFGIIGISRDITERVQVEALREEQAAIFEMIATSAPLETVLDRIVRALETQLPGLVAAILLLDEAGLHLRIGAAPNLGKLYTDAVDGVAIGPKAGWFGSAIVRRETVIVADVMQEASWEDLRGSAAANGIRSCWSTPIISHQGRSWAPWTSTPGRSANQKRLKRGV